MLLTIHAIHTSTGKTAFRKIIQKHYRGVKRRRILAAQVRKLFLLSCIFFGQGTPQNLKVAAQYYKKAALQGHEHAQFMMFQLHNIYRFEESTAEEKAEGLVFLKQAVNSQYPKAVELHNKLYGQEI